MHTATAVHVPVSLLGWGQLFVPYSSLFPNIYQKTGILKRAVRASMGEHIERKSAPPPMRKGDGNRPLLPRVRAGYPTRMVVVPCTSSHVIPMVVGSATV